MTVLVGRQAPDFSAAAVLPDGSIKEKFSLLADTTGRYRLVVFYPLDFTFVCPSELIALDKRMAAFKERNVEVIGVSIDSQFTHAAWRQRPVAEGGIGPVGFTLVADIDHSICQAYGVEHPDAKVAMRGSFLVDQAGVVQAQVVHNLPLGRNMDEGLRMVDALQFFEQHGEVCPAGWTQGDAGMTASSDGVAAYLATHSDRL